MTREITQHDVMDADLGAGAVVMTGDLRLVAGQDDPGSIVSGTPATSSSSVVTYGEVEVGLWEMTPGVMTDVEADEVFVVLTGAASVVIAAEGDGPGRTLTLTPGALVRLTAGMRTTWTVTETLRKLYVAPGEAPSAARA